MCPNSLTYCTCFCLKEMSKISWFLKNYSWFYFLHYFFLNPWFSLRVIKSIAQVWCLKSWHFFSFEVSSKENILSYHLKRLPSEKQLTVCSFWNSCWLIMRLRKRSRYLCEHRFLSHYPGQILNYTLFFPLKRVGGKLYHGSLNICFKYIS